MWGSIHDVLAFNLSLIGTAGNHDAVVVVVWVSSVLQQSKLVE